MVLWEGDRASLWAVYDERDPVGLEEGCEECHQKLRKKGNEIARTTAKVGRDCSKPLM